MYVTVNLNVLCNNFLVPFVNLRALGLYGSNYLNHEDTRAQRNTKDCPGRKEI